MVIRRVRWGAGFFVSSMIVTVCVCCACQAYEAFKKAVDTAEAAVKVMP
jgi:hypothetical protein